jgi:Flp pilus assembly protein TadG
MCVKPKNNHCRSFLANKSGSIGMMFATALIPAVAAIGIAVDYGRGASAQRDLQASVDAAALAVATADLNQSAMTTTVGDHLSANTAKHDISNLAFSAIKNADGTVTVSASGEVRTTFAAILKPQMAVGGSATAGLGGSGKVPTCVYALATTGTGLVIDSDGRLQADCGVQVNSTASNALQFSSGGKVETAANCIVGGVSYDGGSSATPSPVTNCAAKADPLASLPAPSEATGACNFTKMKIREHSRVTLQPGVYCGGIDIQNNSTVNFQPGIYIMRDGPLKTSSSVSLKGTEVFFYFTGQNDYLFVDSSSTTNFTAPNTGPYTGVLFFQDRASAPTQSQLDSGNQTKLQGAVYFPSSDMHLDSSSSTVSDSDGHTGAEWTLWIARKLIVDSATVLTIKSHTPDSTTPLPPSFQSTSQTLVLVH